MKNFAFIGTQADIAFLPMLKPFFKGYSCYNPPIGSLEYLTVLKSYCTKRQITGIISTCPALLKKLVSLQDGGEDIKNPSINDYQGSLFEYDGIEILFIAPLEQLRTTSTGKFIAARFISKLTDPASWREPTQFKWTLATPSNMEDLYARAASSFLLATDIETVRTNLAIRCVGYTGIYLADDGTLKSFSFVIPMDSEWALAQVRRLNTLPVAKIFQNGKYDNIYFLRYNSPVTNWLWDTAHFMHSWYAELPKDLGFLNSFFLRKVVYWKDLAETNDLHTYYRYNALDTWATANVLISQILEAPDWAKRNYFLEFPLVYPCLLSEATGIRRDPERHVANRLVVKAKEESALSSLRKILTSPGFNPGSYIQVRKLLNVLTGQVHTESDEPYLKKISFLHPLNSLVLGKILAYRGLQKLRATYLRTDDDITKTSPGGAKEYRGFILYSINPHGTETGRNASRESAFWCGLQIQNIPGGTEVKSTLRSEDGFYLGECDLEQAESRDTAYIAGDTKLIEAVSGPYDFHSFNASSFFGRPYGDIYDQENKKVKDKKLRTLAKPINHGANYNMGPAVLVDSMGTEMVWEAKAALNLPFKSPLEITEALLVKFHLTYPGLKGQVALKSKEVQNYFKLPSVPYKLFAPGTYYASVAMEVSMTSKLVSRAYHHTPFNLRKYPDAKDYIEEGDWTRYCFGDPEHNKLDLNAYVAHAPQSLNARTLNEAFMLVFYEVALPFPKEFRLHAQIHDSILFSYKQGREDLPDKVREIMEIPVTVRDVHGTYRTFTVPAALKLGRKNDAGELIRATYWSDTE